MSSLTYDLTHLLKDLKQALKGNIDVSLQVSRVEAVLHRFLASPFRFDTDHLLKPNADRYARYLLYRHPRDLFSVVAMVWAPHQCTAVHDHDGVWCVEAVSQGDLEVTQFDLTSGAGDDALVMDPRSRISAGPGSVGNLIPPFEYHRIENKRESVAVSIHVYGRELKTCRRYVPNGDGTFRREIVKLCYDRELQTA